MTFRLAVSVLVGIVLILIYVGSGASRQYVFEPLALGALTGLAASLATFEAGILQAEKRFRELAVLTALPGFGRLVLLMTLMLVVSLTGQIAMIAYLLPQGAAALLFLPRLPLTDRWWRLANRKELRLIWVVSRWIAMAAVVEMFVQRIDIIGLRVLSSSRQTGIYAGAFLFISITNVLITSVNALTYPAMVSAAARRNIEALRLTFAAGTSLLACAGIPAVLFIVSIFPNIVGLVLGPAYRSAIAVIDVLAIYGVVAVIQYNCGGLYLAVGRPRLVVLVSSVLLATDAIGVVLLVPSWGAIGAAVAISVGVGLVLPVSWFAVVSLIGPAVPTRAVLIALGGSLGTLLLVMLISTVVRGDGWQLALKSGAWALTGVSLMVFVARPATAHLEIGRGNG